MTKCTRTLLLGIAVAYAAGAMGCSDSRDNNGAIKKPKDASTDMDAGGDTDTGVPNMNMDTGVPNPNPDANVPADTGVPNPDAGVPADTGVVTPPFDGGMLTGDPFNPSALAGEYSTAICAFTARCEPAVFEFLGENEAECRTRISTQLLNFWPAFAEAISSNRAAFRRAGFDTCLQAYTNADCITAVAPDACEGMFFGNRAEGVACGTGIECGTGHWCSLQQLGGCGTCTRYATVNEDCSANLCEPTMNCFEVGGPTPVCAPINAQENGACGTVQTGLCQGHLQCVGAMAGTCRRPANAGQACDPMGMAAVTCNIFQSQVCVTPGNTCQTTTFVGPGQMCGPTAQCNADALGCGMATMTCDALPGAGLACPDMACADGAFCDMAGTCQTDVPPMGACMTSAECGDLYCVTGTCGVLDWQLCN